MSPLCIIIEFSLWNFVLFSGDVRLMVVVYSCCCYLIDLVLLFYAQCIPGFLKITAHADGSGGSKSTAVLYFPTDPGYRDTVGY